MAYKAGQTPNPDDKRNRRKSTRVQRCVGAKAAARKRQQKKPS